MQHFVCTLDEARQIIDRSSECWVADCGCRASRGSVCRSRTDVCLRFGEKTAGSDENKRRITRGEVEAILEEARDKFLVPLLFGIPGTPLALKASVFAANVAAGTSGATRKPATGAGAWSRPRPAAAPTAAPA